MQSEYREVALKKSLQNYNQLANDFTFNIFYANSAFRKKIFKNQIAKFGGLLEKIIKIHFGPWKKSLTVHMWSLNKIL